jgi:hypothetical protein
MSTKEKPKFKPVFNIIEVITVKQESSKKKPKNYEIKQNRKVREIEQKYEDIEIVSEDFVFESSDNSINKFIKECHPDIQKMITKNNINSVKASSHKLEVKTNNRLFIEISVISKFSRRIIVKDKRRKVLIDTITNITHFSKVEN